MTILITPNMSLPNPLPGQETGPQYATDIYNSMNVIDVHNHSPGQGVLIPSSGLNINAALSFNNFALTGVSLLTLQAQGSAPPVLSLGTQSADLYYTDGNGNVIRITQGGAVSGASGTITGLPSGTASASYNSGSGTFTFLQASSTPANMYTGPIKIGPPTSGSFGVTIQAYASLAGNYSLTLPPALPGANALLTFNTDGTMTTISQTGGIIGSMIAANTITRANEAAVGQQISSSTGVVSVTTSPAVIAATSSFATTGRPVMVMFQADGTTNASLLQIPTGVAVTVSLFRDSTQIATYSYSNSNTQTIVVGTGFAYLDVPSASTHQYTVKVQTGSATATIQYYQIAAYEL